MLLMDVLDLCLVYVQSQSRTRCSDSSEHLKSGKGRMLFGGLTFCTFSHLLLIHMEWYGAGQGRSEAHPLAFFSPPKQLLPCHYLQYFRCASDTPFSRLRFSTKCLVRPQLNNKSVSLSVSGMWIEEVHQDQRGIGSLPKWDAQNCHKQVAAGQDWGSIDRPGEGGIFPSICCHLAPAGTSQSFTFTSCQVPAHCLNRSRL